MPSRSYGIGFLDEGGALPSETLKRLTCDASVVVVVSDDDGKVLKLTGRTRTIPRAVRRAMKARDKQCRLPGCTNTRYLDAHHIVHWISNGETKLYNLLLLCPYHHRLHHEGLFTVRTDDDGATFVFTHRAGHVIEAKPMSVEPGGVERENEEFGIGVDGQTISAKWGGESCDYGVAVSCLYRLAEQNGSAEPPEQVPETWNAIDQEMFRHYADQARAEEYLREFEE